MRYIKNVMVSRWFLLSFMALCVSPFQAKAGPIEDLKALLQALHGDISRARSDDDVPALLNNFQTNPAVVAAMQQIPCSVHIVSGQLATRVPASEVDCSCFPECRNPGHQAPFAVACPTPKCVPIGSNTRNCADASCSEYVMEKTYPSDFFECCRNDNCCTCCPGDHLIICACCWVVDPLAYFLQALSLSLHAGRSVGASAINAGSCMFPCWTYQKKPMLSLPSKSQMLKILAALIAWCDEITRISVNVPPPYLRKNFSGSSNDAGGAGPASGAASGFGFALGNTASQ